MAAEPTFDQTTTADGITVRLHRMGEKLTVEITDPAGALRELDVVDGCFTEPIASVTGLGAKLRRQAAVAPLFAALDTIDQATLDAVWEALHPFPTAVDAHNELWWAVGEAGYEREWAEIMTEVREACEHRGLKSHQYVTMPILAGAYRDLIGTRGYTAEHYEALTSSWRVLVGRIHPADADLAEPSDELVMSRQIMSLWQFATAELTVDTEMADRMLDARPSTRNPRYRDARRKALSEIQRLGREGSWRQVTAKASRFFNPLDRARREECMAVLRDVVLALVLRDGIADDFHGITQADYDMLTRSWREQIETICPSDRDLFQPAS